MQTNVVDSASIKAAQEKLDAHVREIIQWHFSPETGCPFWLEWAAKAGWSPLKEVRSFADIQRFPHFQREWLRDLQPGVWVSKELQSEHLHMFVTIGPTGLAKQRPIWM